MVKAKREALKPRWPGIFHQNFDQLRPRCETFSWSNYRDLELIWIKNRLVYCILLDNMESKLENDDKWRRLLLKMRGDKGGRQPLNMNSDSRSGISDVQIQEMIDELPFFDDE